MNLCCDYGWQRNDVWKGKEGEVGGSWTKQTIYTTKGSRKVISDLKLISNQPLLTEGVEGLCYEAAFRPRPTPHLREQPAANHRLVRLSSPLSLSPSLPPLPSLLLRLSSSTGKHKLGTCESPFTYSPLLLLLLDGSCFPCVCVLCVDQSECLARLTRLGSSVRYCYGYFLFGTCQDGWRGGWQLVCCSRSAWLGPRRVHQRPAAAKTQNLFFPGLKHSGSASLLLRGSSVGVCIVAPPQAPYHLLLFCGPLFESLYCMLRYSYLG